MSILTTSILAAVTLLSGFGTDSLPTPRFVLIPGGSFEMGCHDTLGSNDEFPVHLVRIDSFYMMSTPVTNEQYCAYLNSTFAQGQIEVNQGIVTKLGDTLIYCLTAEAADSGSSIHFNVDTFTITVGRENHPMVCVRWFGAVAYSNWLSAESGYASCYNLSTWACDFDQNGYRLPTEAEWEYAARSGEYSPYYTYPWGNNRDTTKTNWPNSGDPYEAGPRPWTTPVGFYNGELHYKGEFNWPGLQNSYQTTDGANGYGLYDMAGNVWNWCNDWYGRDYYSVSPEDNPRGPDSGTPMPDGKPYRCLRGGSWYNATRYPGDHSRCSNRDPAYYRGPGDPNGPWFQIGFRLVRAFRVLAAVNGNETRNGKLELFEAISPYCGRAKIRFETPIRNHVILTIFDLAGRKFKVLMNGLCYAGVHYVTWDGTDDAGRKVCSGVFLCQLKYDNVALSAKLIKLN